MSEEEYPDGLRYHHEHHWVRLEGELATFGITWFAQDSLDEIVFWDPPKVGDAVTKDEAYSELESVKAVTDVIAPLSGSVVEVNEALAKERSILNESPYEDGWLVRVRPSDPSERDALLDVEAYRGLL